jgi:CheY-like chemotaxis protein/anti-sigma regulatory factor (Ser/Thr protein kinase)
VDSDELEVVDMGDVIAAACKLAEGVIRPRARLIKNLMPVSAVQGDRNRLVQVFTNLLTNAAHAIEGPGRDNEIRVATVERDGRVIASVEDTGCGIPAAIRTLVFEPFFTTKPRDQGTGLGLALSAEIVHRYGGDIGFTALSAGGTRFEVRLLPSASQPAGREPVMAGPAALPALPAQRARVLLVDDEPSLLRAFRRVLAPQHDVVMAMGGQQALDILARDAAFDGVICDFAMPEVDGIHIYEAVARRDSELAGRIVFCTGGPMSHRGRMFIASTSNTVLEKPVPPDLLLGAIEQLGKR